MRPIPPALLAFFSSITYFAIMIDMTGHAARGLLEDAVASLLFAAWMYVTFELVRRRRRRRRPGPDLLDGPSTLRRARTSMGSFFALAMIGNAAALVWDLSGEPWRFLRVAVSVGFVAATVMWAYCSVAVRRTTAET